MKFKLMAGMHEGDSGRHRKGDVFESSIDLAKRFNQPGSQKFMRLPDDAPTVAIESKASGSVALAEEPVEVIPDPNESNNGFSRSELESLTLSDVKEIAKDLGLDLTGVKQSSKVQLIAAILK